MKCVLKFSCVLVLLCTFGNLAKAQMLAHFINVGQGSATLIEFPCGAILIDAGGEANNDFNSTDALNSYLHDFFERRSDLHNTLQCLYLTHPHIDHTRGVDDLLKPPYIIKNAVTDGLEKGSGRFQQKKLHDAVSAAEATASTDDDIGFEAVNTDEIPAGGFTNPVIDPVNCQGTNPSIKILWGAVATNTGWSQTDFDNYNNHSLVIKIEYGAASIICIGDLEETAIHDLLQKYAGTNELDADIYVCGHHGSKNGTTQALLDKVSPEMAVISMGDVNRQTNWTAWDYGHPNKGIVDLLQGSVTATRPSVTVKVGKKKQTFVNYTVTKAIYATGWDDTVVLQGDASGTWVKTNPGEVPVSTLVNVNAASTEQLLLLPGIGPSKADAIVTYRNSHGNFTALNDLDNVPGIGPSTLNIIRPYVTF